MDCIDATNNAIAADILVRASLAPEHEVIAQVIDNGIGLEDTEKDIRRLF